MDIEVFLIFKKKFRSFFIKEIKKTIEPLLINCGDIKVCLFDQQKIHGFSLRHYIGYSNNGIIIDKIDNYLKILTFNELPLEDLFLLYKKIVIEKNIIKLISKDKKAFIEALQEENDDFLKENHEKQIE